MKDFLRNRSATLRIVGIYALVGCLWIYTTDTVLGWFVQDPHIMVHIAIFKGSFFIFFTSLLLYFLINRHNRNLAVSEQALQDQVKSLLESETERKQNEEMIRRLENLYAALCKCGQVIVLCKSENELFQEICKIVVQIGGKRMAWIGLTDPETKLVSVAACYGSGVEYLDNIEISVDADSPFGCGPTGTAIREQRPFWCQDYQHDPATNNWREIGKLFGWNASAALPIYKNGEAVGTLTMYSDMINAFDDATQNLLVEMSQNISHALDTIASDASRKKAEEALNESEIRFRSIFKSSPIAIGIGRASNGEMIDVNEAWLRLFGYERDEVIGHTTEELSVYPKEEERSQIIDIIKDRGWIVNQPMQLRHKSGAIIEVLYSADIVTISSEPCLQVLMTDITANRKFEEEKKVLEQQLLQSQKLESLGVLAGGIAHDFNNILQIILGACALIKMDSETAECFLPQIEQAAKRAAGLCNQMLTYAGKSTIAPTQVILWPLVDEIVSMLKKTIKQNVVINCKYQPYIPYIKGDADQLGQIVMNLIINAAEAIGTAQGEVAVSLAKTTIHPGQSDKDYNGKEITPGEYACLEVTDTGCGMDDEAKWRIFEPFYTTKFTGRGLGMSAVLGIVKSHKGALQLFSTPGQGTTIKVYLPAQISDSAGNIIVPQAPLIPWQGSGTILLVDDEDQIRIIAKTILKKMGFGVLEASNGREALQLYQKNKAAITLVLTDIGMPVMDGYEMSRELKKLDLEIPVVISSGFGDAEVTTGIAREDIAGLVSKPYNPDQLRNVLRKILDNKPA
ncbi:MAG: GAF domain-containing protein [Desulfuromonadales bacterium]